MTTAVEAKKKKTKGKIYLNNIICNHIMSTVVTFHNSAGTFIKM